VTVVTTRAGRQAVGRVPPGGMEQQRPWWHGGAWRRGAGAPGSGGECHPAA